jgi:metal-responsive CopG/Arc/MetJ family transcriptional regulator
MPRTIIEIPDTQLREVDRLCQLLGISRAEAVRRGLQGFVQQNEAVRTDGFGLWKSAFTPEAITRHAVKAETVSRKKRPR